MARYSLPPYLNVCVMAVKASSVLSIISVWELTLASREIIERTLDVYRVLTVAARALFRHVLRHRPCRKAVGKPPGSQRFCRGTAVIEIRGMRKSFGAVEILRGIDLTIGAGEILALIGRSGCGKTTLLRCINFLEDYDAGEIKLDGRGSLVSPARQGQTGARVRKRSWHGSGSAWASCFSSTISFRT